MIRMYTTERCGDCYRAKRFLDTLGLQYEEIDIDHDKEAELLVIKQNNGRRRVPTLSIGDRFFGNPPLDELGRILNIRTN